MAWRESEMFAFSCEALAMADWSVSGLSFFGDIIVFVVIVL